MPMKRVGLDSTMLTLPFLAGRGESRREDFRLEGQSGSGDDFAAIRVEAIAIRVEAISIRIIRVEAMNITI